LRGAAGTGQVQGMPEKLIVDCFGRSIRLTKERLAHVLTHTEMQGMEPAIAHSLQVPQLVRRSKTDPDVRLFYEFQGQTPVGAKWLCVVVKYLATDAFIVTAYLTDKPKTGEDLWPTK
jgi:hypothetical protein